MTPLATSQKDVARFVEAREAWIRRQLVQYQRLEARKQEAKGQTLWFMGEQLVIDTHCGVKSLVQSGSGVLNVTTPKPLDDGQLDRHLSKWLRVQAGTVLPQRLESLSQQTDLHGSGLQIKQYTARWGSCRHDGLIQLNWKLIKTPAEVIDYVIIHELSHLRHFNHSVAFWKLVEQHCPGYKTQRNWLKENGRLLISA